MATPWKHKHLEMIGRLAEDQEIKGYASYGRTSVFINTQKELQYTVKSISVRNEVAEDQFTGYITSIRNLDFVDDQYSSDEERIQEFIEFYKDALFVFSYAIDPSGNWKIDKNDADIIPLGRLKVEKDSRFVAVPCFSGKSNCDEVQNVALFRKYESFDQFKKMLYDKKPLGKIYNFQINDSTSFPEFVIWEDDDCLIAVGPIKGASRTSTDEIVMEIDPDECYEINLETETGTSTEYIIQSEINPSIIHMTEAKYLEIINDFSQQSTVSVDQASDIISTGPTGEEESHSVSENHCEETTVSNVIGSNTEKLRKLPSEKTESGILEFFRYHSQMKKLFYAPKDITNFHTALKTGNLVILSGMSGTGKSALVDTYAKALGIEKNVLIIPVRPSWNDDSDLLGYVDLIHMVYRPSDTGFINKIVEASRPENKDSLYLICLDEMNLARVEHYFSQFLSILEKPVGSRELILYDEQYAGQLYNSSKYPQRITIGENVKFIGTVNIDESTYHFSDKVLDRANVITLQVLDYSQSQNWKVDKYQAANTPEWKSEEYNKLVKKEDIPFELQGRLREFLWKTHCMLQNINSNLGVGPRIVKSIEAYLRNLPECEEEYAISIPDGIDYQVAQRVLTKIRGPEEQLKGLFNCDQSRQSCALTELFDEFSDISNFDKCRQSVNQKEKELSVYGYCL